MITVWNAAVITLFGSTFTFLFIKPRFSLLKTAVIYYGVMLAALAAEVAVALLYGMELAKQLYTLLIHVPLLLTSAVLGTTRGWQLLFQLMSSIYFSQLIMQFGALALSLTGWYWLQFSVYFAAAAAIIAAQLRWFRPLFRRVFSEIRRGWWLPCLVLAIYYAIGAYVLPNTEETNFVLRPALALLMLGFYALIILLFTTMERELETRHSAELAAVQASAFKARMDSVRAAEEAIRLERHDLRHRIHTAQELVRRSNREAALCFLDDAEKRLDEIRPVHWCRPPVLDAVFSSSFSQAERLGITVEADISLAPELPVDEAELAIVLSNVLDNAVTACASLEGERRIRCKAISRPGLMLEVGNTASGADIRFDTGGRPMASRAGHGLGTRSVDAFCQKHGAVSRYEYADGWFTFRLIM